MSSAYYNENDPYAAQWLRNLISAGHIASGDVDERSIVDVRADDLAGYVQCHFFAGIGGWPYALRLAGWPDDRPVWTGSCPCQPFSEGGKRSGFQDARDLWPVWFNLIRERAPSVIFGEQVAGAIIWLDRVFSDLEEQNYAPWRRRYCQLVPSMRPTVEIASGLWPTPKASAAGETSRSGKRKNELLMGGLVRHLAPQLWPTPTAVTDSGGAALCKWGGTRSRDKLRQAVTPQQLNGALDPAFPCWLMGYPPEWLNCAPSAAPSSRKSQRNLSSQQQKPLGDGGS